MTTGFASEAEFTPPPASPPLPVELDVFPPQRQRRWTVLLRLLLAIPQLIMVWVLGIAIEVAMLLGWFAALAMGRLPTWCGEIIRTCVTYTVRVYGYLLLLVDQYPPFSMDPPVDYPVRVYFPPPTRLNRLAVLFRLPLVLPMLLLTGLLFIGWGVLAVFIWLITLILGYLPRPVFQASAALLRTQLRTYAYFGMVTPTYPFGAFGDRAPTTEFAPASASPTRPLVVSTAGRILLIAFLVIGVLYYVGSITLSAHNASNSRVHYVSSETVADHVSTVYTNTYGHPPQQVSCPADLPSQLGANESCIVDDTTHPATAEVTVTDVHGRNVSLRINIQPPPR
ncbi:DUF4389 domain-containing protein [Nocardia sp. CDC160]|uniref:DUF4389 domain-containing protein n=1 Tax=Nocardia sp. CDC160 TaxID=3112166 RepID=UPI002DBB6603|nr:DUF4389 domain-containing protein [Nocardia sp. CDC160]MEC3918565.1 DUF4389 domain-containing protein [Nocardia sp. CDC160]